MWNGYRVYYCLARICGNLVEILKDIIMRWGVHCETYIREIIMSLNVYMYYKQVAVMRCAHGLWFIISMGEAYIVWGLEIGCI
jgi:hypothetical protein